MEATIHSSVGEVRPVATPAARILVVDDEPCVRRAYQRVLKTKGHTVDTANDGVEALQKLGSCTFDAVVTDIAMPRMDGVTLLSTIRATDADLPVILVTGGATVDTAIQAVNHSATSYLTKPVDQDTLSSAVKLAVALRQSVLAMREAAEVMKGREQTLQCRTDFDRGLEQLWIAYQPLVDSATGRVYGYEALLRSRHPPMANPLAFLDAATRLGELPTLGRVVRDSAARPLLEAPERGVLFVNIHPDDLLDDSLYDPDTPLGRMSERVVLELTERARIDTVPELGQRISRLRTLGFRIAVDDLGAGYAGLSSIASLEPEIIKLDMSLIRDADKLPLKQRLISSLIPIAKHLGARVVAEGVETVSERDTLGELGCHLFQGYLFAKPGKAFPDVSHVAQRAA